MEVFSIYVLHPQLKKTNLEFTPEKEEQRWKLFAFSNPQTHKNNQPDEQ